MILTPENYHSKEANQAYMSVSQYKEFIKCEAHALSKLSDEHKDEDKTCFLVGSYVHAGIEGDEALEAFKESHPEIYSSRGASKGELKAEYKHADRMLQVIKDDELCRSMLSGGKEVILTADLFGVKWKCRIDVLAEEHGRITDLKTVKEIRSRHWNEVNREWESFVEHYGYVTQMSVYSELERIHAKRFDPLEPFIVAVSKENEPDKAVICFDEQSIYNALQDVKKRLPRVIAVKEGIEEPKRCEKCEYCRKTKKAEIIHFMNLVEV